VRSAARLPRAAVVVALALAASTVLVAAAAPMHHARAEADQVLLGLGARVMAFPDATLEEPRSIRLNGIDLLFKSQSVDASVEEVLGHYRRGCVNAGESTSVLAPFLNALATRSVVRREQGYVACLSIEAADLETFAHRVERFATSGDLSELGALRYAYARRSEESRARTLLLTLWADGPVNLRNLLPASGGDAGGEDLPGAPRPARARRVLSFHEPSGSSRIVVYVATDVTLAHAAQDYRAELVSHGWKLIERNPGRAFEIDGTLMVAAERGPSMITALTQSAPDGRTVLILLQSEAK